MTAGATPLLGLVVNPVAGVGGRLALKGSDDSGAIERALAAGVPAIAAPRALRALRRLAGSGPGLRVLAPHEPMGAELSRRAGLATTALRRTPRRPTCALDTCEAVAELAERGVDLLLFAGGDGTARDVGEAVGGRVPVLGIPCGVKMRSGVFATTPEAAGEAAGRYLADPDRYGLREAEIVDAAGAEGGLASALHGTALVPGVAGRLQAVKSAAPRSDDAALEALCAGVAAAMEPGRIYLLGPGTTTARVARALGLASTPLGVDAVRDGRLLGTDLDERALLALLPEGTSATLVLGVIGSQGFLLGRGNQQLSPEVVRRVGARNLLVLAGADKVLALDPPELHVDLGDPVGEPVLVGYVRVRMAPDRSIMLRVAA